MRVADLIEAGLLVIGDGYRAKRSELSTAGLPFARAGNVDGRFDFSTADRFPIEDLQKVGPKRSLPGDVVFTSKGTVGRFAFVNDATPEFVYSPQLCFWRSLDHGKLDPRFLFYWMRSREFAHQVAAVKSQTDMADYVSLADQRRMTLSVPPIREQRAISDFLGLLDDKIDLNREINRTLEKLTRSVFKSWFIDFDPVVAKADGRQPFGMSEEVAALFPDRFEDSEVGLIPEHWAVRSVPEVFEINPARELQKGTIAPYLSMQSTPTSGPVPDLLETRRYGSGVRFRNGDSLVAKITPCLENGKTAFVNFLEEHEVGWGSTEFIVLRSKQGIPPVFSYFFARDDGFRGHAIANMTGSSGRQRVPASSLERFRFPLPSPPILEFFGKLADAAMAVIGENVAQSRTLAELRDLLLPKLLSGEIRLAEAEEAVEAMGA